MTASLIFEKKEQCKFNKNCKLKKNEIKIFKKVVFINVVGWELVALSIWLNKARKY